MCINGALAGSGGPLPAGGAGLHHVEKTVTRLRSSAARDDRFQAVRITEMCSVPLSGSQISPGRPRIWRTLAFGRGMA